MDAGMPHSTLHEQRWLISFSLALGSGCLIKCKHLNDLSYSVYFLSIILLSYLLYSQAGKHSRSSENAL